MGRRWPAICRLGASRRSSVSGLTDGDSKATGKAADLKRKDDRPAGAGLSDRIVVGASDGETPGRHEVERIRDGRALSRRNSRLIAGDAEADAARTRYARSAFRVSSARQAGVRGALPHQRFATTVGVAPRKDALGTFFFLSFVRLHLAATFRWTSCKVLTNYV